MTKLSGIMNLLFLVMISYSCATRNTKMEPPTTAKNQPVMPKPKDYPGNHWNIKEVGTRDVGRGLNIYSIDKEIALGHQLAQDVQKGSRIIEDSVIAEYVNRIGQNLVRNSDAKIPFVIKLIDHEEVNAFALPGGFLFVNSGLILKTESEAELAGVMAHEIAHITARHGTRQASRGQIIDIASLPLIFMGGWAGYGIRQAAGFMIPVTFLKFSRNFEREADELGAQYLYLAGYDPLALGDFFEKLEAMNKKKQGKINKIFSTHPTNPDRMKFVQNILSFKEVFSEKSDYVVTTLEFQETKDHLQTMNDVWRKKDAEDEANRPKLKRRGMDKIEVPDEEKTDKKEDAEEKPKLKRKN